ncbi:MAG: NusG domain II-containing protein [Candidatus Accumulibacter sp.]|jgi:hypothetical protein|nr:NusG domain II-containing protein [Accumulibacter sp.]
MRWLNLLRPGDWALAAGAALLCAASFPLVWQGGRAERAIVARGGETVAELDLSRDRRIEVAGPLGTTVVAVEKGRARVVSDPGPRQYCVRQGWLARSGEIAICAPNEISVRIVGGGQAYDSIAY